MRYCLVILILICLSTVTTPANAEMVRGRVLSVEPGSGQLQLEVDTPSDGGRRQLTLQLDRLPADLQLGSQVDVELTVDDGVMKVKKISKGSGWGHGKDMTGVRSRLKKAQRGSSGGQGSGGGGRH